MSRAEQDALLSFVNMFKSASARRVNVFSSLADGRLLMEVSSCGFRTSNRADCAVYESNACGALISSLYAWQGHG